MRRLLGLSIFLGMSCIIVLGCSRQGPAKEDPKPNVQVNPPKVDPGQNILDPNVAPPLPPFPLAVADGKQEKYEAALGEALTLLADRKLPQALVALETARTFQDNEFIQGEIAKVKGRIEQEATAQKSVRDIETVLEGGKAADAAKLAQQALKEFGDGDASDQFVKLRLQADALQNADKDEDAPVRFQRFRAEGDAALKEKNLRAAALAFEQALAAKDDARVQEQLDGIRAALEKYDSMRKRAAELRRDPAALEDALEALKLAAQEWDTLQVRQDIDECTLALEKRRDTASVADFEVRGDVGLADAGRALAEELLPLLKPRFDLVERNQVAKVLHELKLEANFADDPEQQRELGKLAKVRYLVLGSVSRLSGVTVSARLVDVRTGLIMQTAKVSAPSAEAALTLLPELAKQLLMSDDEKRAYEQQQWQLAKRPAPFAADAALPPPPPVPLPDAAPFKPAIFEVPVPPDFGGLRIEAFQKLPPAPLMGQALPPLPPPVETEVVVKNRLLQAVITLGDDLFRRGDHRDAQRHFEFALTLAPGNFDLRLRLERNQPFVPPPVQVVVIDQPVIVIPPRQRIAILNFMTVGDPIFVPAALGPWTAYNITPYFRQYFDVVDANDVYWYMNKMGLTLRDLMEDPAARRWLGRALNVRYFVLGTLQETASFDAVTYMLDAEYGFLQGSGRVHVRSAYELKMRLAELARLTMMSPNERVAFLSQSQRFDNLILKGRQHLDRREFSLAVVVFDEAVRLRPGNVEALSYLNQSRGLSQRFAWEEERRRRFQAQKAAEEAARHRQWELAQAVEVARLRSIQEAAAQNAAERARQEELRRRAQEQLMAQARIAIKTKNFTLSLGLFQGAAGLAPANDNVLREMAQARIEADKSAHAHAAQQALLAQAALQKQRELDLEQARKKVAQERLLAQAALETQKKVQEERDKNAFQRAFDEAQRQLAKGNYDAAIGALQLARQPAQQIGKANLVEAMLNQALVEQAKGTQRAELEKKLAAERERRKIAEAEAMRNQALYQTALALAQKALADKNLEIAQAKYNEAAQLFKTDAVLTGLARVETARAKMAAEDAAAKAKALEDQQRTERLQKFLADGKSALDAKNFDKAMTAFLQAKKLAPDNLDVLTNLTRTEQARDKALADARRLAEEKGRLGDFQKLLKNGQANLAAKQYDAAIANLGEALKLNPDSAEARAGLQQAQKAHDALLADAKSRDEAKLKTAAYQKLISQGRLALEAKRFDDALQAFASAQKLLPGDQTAIDLAKDAQARKQAQIDTLTAEAKKKADELQRAAELQKAFQGAFLAGQKAMAGKNYEEAIKSFTAAAKLMPDDQKIAALLQQAQKALTDNSAGAKKQADYLAALQSGQKALAGMKFDDALKAFTEAARIMPGDAKALQFLQETQKAVREANDNAKKQADFLTFIQAGQKAMAGMKFTEAVQSFGEAAKLNPGDPKTQQLLQQAQKALDASKTKTPPPLDDPKAKLQQELDNGAAMEKQKKYPEALKSYKEALKIAPEDMRAKDGAKRTEFIVHTLDGQKFLEMLKYADAIREFEAALVLSPNNPAVTKLLAKAKAGKK